MKVTYFDSELYSSGNRGGSLKAQLCDHLVSINLEKILTSKTAKKTDFDVS